MNINRHNYEEYFILYVDNELSREERLRVEEFAALHPDLKDELDWLMQSKLSPDQHIVFANKEELLQSADLSAAINMHNYEEWLVMYMDNELTGEERIAVEKFAAQHYRVQQELNLLQKTKLQPETISFTDKESLYRREEKVRHIPVWWRMATAAAIVLTVGTTALLVLNNDDGQVAPQTAVAKTNPAAEKQPAVMEVANNNKKENTVQEKMKQPATSPEKINNTAVFALKDNKAVPKTTKKQEVMAPANEDPVFANNKKASNHLPLPDQNPNVNPALLAEAGLNSSVKTNLTTPIQTINTSPVTNDLTKSYIKSASFPETEMISDDDEQPEEKKNKLRGFFRKVTRTFEKRTNIDATDGDDRLLVAGLSIKLK